MKTDRRGWTRKTLDLLASWVWLAAVGVTVLETVGCAGVSTTPTPISVSVTISPILATVAAGGTRSEERRVGEGWRSRWSPDHLKKKKTVRLTMATMNRQR